ncbi:MAG TPA: bifunctional YncE family protein/alkaline phosphatase family protein [Candidatus Acidoferrales bacterium]|nr:bifunctional YncE family protein/alkaline phosphatase family protein [Candidatus Acidoferrales bacterium]
MLLALVLAAGVVLPTGQSITPLAAAGSTMLRLATGLRADGNADASGAMATALSPDGRTLAVLTSGYNYQYYRPDGAEIRFPLRDPVTGRVVRATTELTQWIFLYGVTPQGLHPLQHLAIPDAFCGIAWAPDGTRFYVSGGIDDRIAVYARRGETFVFEAPEVLLGHDRRQRSPIPSYDGSILSHTLAGRRGGAFPLRFGALAAGIGLTADGRTLAVANMQNDSVTIVDTATRRPAAEIPLFEPGSTRAVGEYPYGIAVRSNANGGLEAVYASSLRDGDVAAIAGGRPAFVEVGGAPNALLLSHDGSRLYAANGDLDEVDEIDTATLRLTRRISVDRPGQPYRGANPNGLALDETSHRLYVSLGGENAVAVVDLDTGTIAGRIPTGWYPTALTLAGDRLLVADAKSPSGPNPGLGAFVAIVGSRRPDPSHRDQYVLDLEKADVLEIPVPSDTELQSLSATVDANNGFVRRRPDAIVQALRGKIRHVIFIMKENRTYDQVLGDLPNADGDPRLTSFPYAIAPNHHELARQFVTFDNFYTSGDVSGDGWNWSTQARANEYTTRVTPIEYASDGFSLDTNGTNRLLNVALPEKGGTTPFGARLTTLLDPSGSSAILPGTRDVAATGYVWDAARRAGKSVRHYGLYTDQTYYTIGVPFYIPIVRAAYAKRALQSPPVQPSLRGITDRYYRGWDLNVPDRYRYEEWKREFDGYVRRGDLPDFEAVCLMMDHFGNFATNVGGLNTPYLQMSDDDYALGLLVQTVSHSRYWKDTAIFVLEDDAQDGPDHVDSHRSIAYAISAYTRRRTVVHARYDTVAMLRTIEDLLGIGHLSIFDANAPDMSQAFTTAPDTRDRYAAVLPGDLCRPPVRAGLEPECAQKAPRTAVLLPRRGAAWWIAQTRGMDFDRPDAVDPLRFNALLDEGL